MAMRGKAIKGIHQGEWTVCHAKDPHTCPFHVMESHRQMSDKEADKANEKILFDKINSKARAESLAAPLSKKPANALSEHMVRSHISGFFHRRKPRLADRQHAPSAMKKNLRKAAIGLMVVSSLSGLAACGNNTDANMVPAEDQTAVESTMSTLDSAKTISVTKKLLSFGDNWEVKADGNKVASIKGDDVPIYGDTYVMRTTGGDLIASEQKQKIHSFADLNSATTRDSQNNKDGKITKPAMQLGGYKFTRLDADGNVIATAKQKIKMGLTEYKVTDTNGQTEWTIKEKMDWQKKYEVTSDLKDGEEHDVSGKDAAMMTSVISEITGATHNNSATKAYRAAHH